METETQPQGQEFVQGTNTRGGPHVLVGNYIFAVDNATAEGIETWVNTYHQNAADASFGRSVEAVAAHQFTSTDGERVTLLNPPQVGAVIR